jgi:hypothetical protein
MRIALALLVLACAACGAITPAPAVGTPLTSSQLKFKVIDSVGKPVFCDRDFYPIAREGGEQANAITQYPLIKADSEAYAALVAHENLPTGDLTDGQKLVLYRAWKLLQALTLNPAGADYSFSYRVQPASGTASYQLVAGAIRVDGVVTVSSRTPTGPPNCPICLAAATLISTPTGTVRVTEIKPGMLVWTANAEGARIAEPVLEIGNTQVPSGHLMVHLVLADGRELLASPGHRTADGRQLGSLALGDSLDGSRATVPTIFFLPAQPASIGRTASLCRARSTVRLWGREPGNRLGEGGTVDLEPKAADPPARNTLAHREVAVPAGYSRMGVPGVEHKLGSLDKRGWRLRIGADDRSRRIVSDEHQDPIAHQVASSDEDRAGEVGGRDPGDVEVVSPRSPGL